MVFAAASALVLITTGLGLVLRAFGAPGAIGVLDGTGKVGANAVLMGITLIALGALWLWEVSRRTNRTTHRWSNYAPEALAAAEAVKGGQVIELPKRPMPVSDVVIDFTSSKPLPTDELEDIVATKLVGGIATLLRPCGESRSYLGRADAIVIHREKDGQPKGNAERLADVWVIDREWNDGRWTTEWLLALPVGHRLRVVGGGTAVGRYEFKPQHRHTITMLLWGFGVLCVVFAGYMGICIPVIWVPLLFGAKAYLRTWFPVEMKAPGYHFAEVTFPGVAFAFRRSIPSDEAALKTRVADVAAELEPLSVM